MSQTAHASTSFRVDTDTHRRADRDQAPSSPLGGAPTTSLPPVTWSFSRGALAEQCERLYYEHYFGSHGGWRADANARARHVYRLKHLTTPGSELGRAIHRRAAEIAHAIRDGASIPSHAALYARTCTELTAVIRRRASDPSWLQNPRHAPLLREAYYGGLSAARREQVLADLCTRASNLLTSLVDSAVWVAATLPGARVLMIEDTILTHTDAVATVATPDLVLQLPDDRVLVVDWKCGAAGDIAQVLAYAEAVHDALGLGTSGVRLEAWLVHLDRGSLEAATVSAADRERSLAARRASVAKLVALHERAVPSDAPPGKAFALAAEPNTTCRRCRMLEACRPELARAATSAPYLTAG